MMIISKERIDNVQLTSVTQPKYRKNVAFLDILNRG